MTQNHYENQQRSNAHLCWCHSCFLTKIKMCLSLFMVQWYVLKLFPVSLDFHLIWVFEDSLHCLLVGTTTSGSNRVCCVCKSSSMVCKLVDFTFKGLLTSWCIWQHKKEKTRSITTFCSQMDFKLLIIWITYVFRKRVGHKCFVADIL